MYMRRCRSAAHLMYMIYSRHTALFYVCSFYFWANVLPDPILSPPLPQHTHRTSDHGQVTSEAAIHRGTEELSRITAHAEAKSSEVRVSQPSSHLREEGRAAVTYHACSFIVATMLFPPDGLPCRLRRLRRKLTRISIGGRAWTWTNSTSMRWTSKPRPPSSGCEPVARDWASRAGNEIGTEEHEPSGVDHWRVQGQAMPDALGRL